jgi:acetolactate synthase-1/2/3 large subunit
MMDAIDAVPGIARAFLRNERLVLITLDKDLRRFGESEFDLLALMHPITTYNTLVSHPEQLEIKTTSAVTLSLGSRKPSHLQIPQNILRTDITSPKLWKRFSDLQHGTRAVAYNWPINTELT